MKDIIKFLMFLIYTITIFFIKNDYFLIVVLCINVLLMFMLKINFKKAINNLRNIAIFVAITVVINYFFMGIKESIIIGVKLFLVCNITYTFSTILTPVQIAKVIEKLLYPIKIINVNPRDISLVICIGIAFIPILKDEMLQSIYALKSKGININFKNIQLAFKPVLISILQRTNDMETSLNAKAF